MPSTEITFGRDTPPGFNECTLCKESLSMGTRYQIITNQGVIVYVCPGCFKNWEIPTNRAVARFRSEDGH